MKYVPIILFIVFVLYQFRATPEEKRFYDSCLEWTDEQNRIHSNSKFSAGMNFCQDLSAWLGYGPDDSGLFTNQKANGFANIYFQKSN